MTPPVVFVSVDTEEDDWGQYHCRRPSVRNVRHLVPFQELCDRYNALPTYLVNWPVVAHEASRTVILELSQSGNAEIGTHIHPWNTPPLNEDPTPWNSMLINLPPALVTQKLTALDQLIKDRLELVPTSFRTGRWGFGPRVAHTLLELGYQVDSSVAPSVDWSPDHGPDYRRAPAFAYRFHPDAPLSPAADGPLVEVPMTVGFRGPLPSLSGNLYEWVRRPVPAALRLPGILSRLGLAARYWLSPELATGTEMIATSRALLSRGARFLNFSFHSPTLVPGLTPFVRNRSDLDTFLGRIQDFLDFCQTEGLRFETLTSGSRVLASRG